MADRQVKQLTEETSVQSGDWYLMQKASNDETVKVAASNINPAQGVSSTNIDFGGAGTGIWWEEIGRTTLTVAGDTITVSSIPARKYLKIIISVQGTGGTISVNLRFNSDTGSNYCYRTSVNGAADGTAVSQTNLTIAGAATQANAFFEGDIINILAQEKLLHILRDTPSAAGSAAVPDRVEYLTKWANTSAQISTVTVANLTGTGDYAIGSEVVVLGHN